VAVGEKYKKYDFSKSKVYFKVMKVGTLTSICRRTERATTLKFGDDVDADWGCSSFEREFRNIKGDPPTNFQKFGGG